MMEKDLIRLEGNGASQLVQLIRGLGRNIDTTFEIGTVTKVNPLAIRLNNTSFELSREDVVLAERLIEKSVDLNIGGSTYTVKINEGLKAGDKVIIASTEEGQTYYVLDRGVF